LLLVEQYVERAVAVADYVYILGKGNIVSPVSRPSARRGRSSPATWKAPPDDAQAPRRSDLLRLVVGPAAT